MLTKSNALSSAIVQKAPPDLAHPDHLHLVNARHRGPRTTIALFILLTSNPGLATDPEHEPTAHEGVEPENEISVVADVGLGPIWAARPGGVPEGPAPDGARYHGGFGLRFNRRGSIAVGWGLQSPVFALNDHWSARDRLPNGRYAVLDLQGELMARYAWPSLVGPLEPIVGASLRSHMAFTSYEHPSSSTTEDAESSASATHFGVGFAPIVGLQWPFDVEPAGRRFVLFAELTPEFVYWLSHSARENHDHPADTGPAVVEALGAMGRTTFQVGTSFGFRLEFE